MLVNVALEAGVLQGEELESAQWARSVHSSAVRALTDHGRLVFATETSRDDFLRALDHLQPQIKLLWRTALEERRIDFDVAEVKGLPSFAEAKSRQQVKATWSKTADLLLLDEYSRELMDYTEGDLPDPDGRPEIADLASVSESTRLAAARAAFTTPMNVGDRRQDEWNWRFLPVARLSKRVSLYDTYAGEQIVRHFKTKDRRDGGLRWLANAVAAAGVSRLAIYTSWVPSGDKETSREEIDAALAILHAECGGTLALSCVASRRTDVEHDRHLCFDSRIAVMVGRGVGLFSEDEISQTSSLGLLSAGIAQDRERRVQTAAHRERPASRQRSRP